MGTELQTETDDDITRMLRNQGSEGAWLAHLSRLSSHIQLLEWELLRRSAQSKLQVRSEDSSETPR